MGGEILLREWLLDEKKAELANEELARLAASITVPRVRADVAAGQVAATLRALTTANLIRQAAGLTTEQTAAQSYAETAAAFALLESGLSALSG